MKSVISKCLPLVFVSIYLVLTGCSPAISSPRSPTTGDVDLPSTQVSTLPPSPTPVHVETSPKRLVHDADTRVGIEEVDRVIDAVLTGEVAELHRVLRYTTMECTHADGLGGPPKCKDEEIEGTAVEVIPILGPEGHHIRKAEIDQFSGIDVMGLYAVYRVSDQAYSDPNFPAGDYAIVFISMDAYGDVTVQVADGGIVRFDYSFGEPPEIDMQREAAEIILPPPSTVPAVMEPWIRYEDIVNRFSFLYPAGWSIEAAEDQYKCHLGDQIEFKIVASDPYWVGCLDEALGDCPHVERLIHVDVAGRAGRRLRGSFGAIGGRIPQEFITYIIDLDGEYLIFTLYALELGSSVDRMDLTWPLVSEDVEVFEQIIASLQWTG